MPLISGLISYVHVSVEPLAYPIAPGSRMNLTIDGNFPANMLLNTHASDAAPSLAQVSNSSADGNQTSPNASSRSSDAAISTLSLTSSAALVSRRIGASTLELTVENGMPYGVPLFVGVPFMPGECQPGDTRGSASANVSALFGTLVGAARIMGDGFG